MLYLLEFTGDFGDCKNESETTMVTKMTMTTDKPGIIYKRRKLLFKYFNSATCKWLSLSVLRKFLKAAGKYVVGHVIRVARHRRLVEPEVLDASSDDDDSASGGEDMTAQRRRADDDMDESDEEEEELSEEEIERRRHLLRQKVAVRAEEEIMDVEEEKEGSEDDSSEYESEYESEEEETGPRLKPVFVRK